MHNIKTCNLQWKSLLIPFLDMELKIHNNNLQSWIWRKPTHTGVFLKFEYTEHIMSLKNGLHLIVPRGV